MNSIRVRSVIAGLIGAGLLALVLRILALTLIQFAHQTTAGLAYWGMSIVAVCTAAFVGGRISEHGNAGGPARAALVFGILELALSALAIVLSEGIGWAWWMNAAYLLPIIPAAMLGGSSAHAKQARQSSP